MMLKKHWKFTFVFIVIGLLHLTGVLTNIQTLALYTKPLIVISLAIYLISATKLKGRFHKRILAGLIFALVGDVLLSFVSENEHYFAYGLVAFMLCHLLYISAFYLDFKSAPELDKRGARLAIICCGIVATAFFFYLRPHLGVMRVPVLAYTLVISFMVMMAAFRNQRVNRLSFNLTIIGAISFMLSDALLAYHKFAFEFPYANFFIMITYLAAQYLITIGAVERKLLHNN